MCSIHFQTFKARYAFVLESFNVQPDSDTSRMTKADLRRLARKKREAEWASFTATKPDDKYENPADVAAIEEAERNMGDFKLKSDPNYVIPEVGGLQGGQRRNRASWSCPLHMLNSKQHDQQRQPLFPKSRRPGLSPSVLQTSYSVWVLASAHVQ